MEGVSTYLLILLCCFLEFWNYEVCIFGNWKCPKRLFINWKFPKSTFANRHFQIESFRIEHFQIENAQHPSTSKSNQVISVLSKPLQPSTNGKTRKFVRFPTVGPHWLTRRGSGAMPTDYSSGIKTNLAQQLKVTSHASVHENADFPIHNFATTQIGFVLTRGPLRAHS